MGSRVLVIKRSGVNLGYLSGLRNPRACPFYFQYWLTAWRRWRRPRPIAMIVFKCSSLAGEQEEGHTSDNPTQPYALFPVPSNLDHGDCKQNWIYVPPPFFWASSLCYMALILARLGESIGVASPVGRPEERLYLLTVVPIFGSR